MARSFALSAVEQTRLKAAIQRKMITIHNPKAVLNIRLTATQEKRQR
jgi:hypothetical protein